MSNSDTEFKWHKIHKFEDYIERQVNERAMERVLEYYAVEDISDLTRKQIDSVIEFANNISEYSPIRSGLYHVTHEWEDLTDAEVPIDED